MPHSRVYSPLPLAETATLSTLTATRLADLNTPNFFSTAHTTPLANETPSSLRTALLPPSPADPLSS